MLCKVRDCHFNTTHLTFYHKCGNCNLYGKNGLNKTTAYHMYSFLYIYIYIYIYI